MTPLTSPVAGDPSQYAPRVAGSVRALRNRRNDMALPASLLWGRLKRAFVRQTPLFIVFTTIIGGFGVVYEVTGGAALLDALAPSAAIGAALAFVMVSIRELGRNTITTLSRLGRHRGFAVLGAAPELTEPMLRELPPDERTPLGCLAHLPASAFATAFRDLQGILSDGRLVSVVAALPGEGATTVALCAAASAAQQGRNVVIVDCDLRHRALTRGFELTPEAGVLEACERPDDWRQMIESEIETGLHILPAARVANPWRSLMGAPGFRLLLRRLMEAYDLVVLDCPPVLASAEGHAIARLADRSVLVAVWDHTPLGAVRTAMRALRARSLGIYVNRVPPGFRFGRLRPD